MWIMHLWNRRPRFFCYTVNSSMCTYSNIHSYNNHTKKTENSFQNLLLFTGDNNELKENVGCKTTYTRLTWKKWITVTRAYIPNTYDLIWSELVKFDLNFRTVVQSCRSSHRHSLSRPSLPTSPPEHLRHFRHPGTYRHISIFASVSVVYVTLFANFSPLPTCYFVRV